MDFIKTHNEKIVERKILRIIYTGKGNFFRPPGCQESIIDFIIYIEYATKWVKG